MDKRITRESTALTDRKRSLLAAIENDRSVQWQLRLWSRFIKTRDGFRCLCCGSQDRIQAHHIVRKTLHPGCALDMGNGITLCPDCHRRVHAQFNGKPDLSLPIGAENGDDQDEWAFLFGLLMDSATRRALPENEFYCLGDAFLNFTVACQGYKELYEAAMRGHISRLRFAHEVWRIMPEGFYTSVVSTLIELNFEPD